jgi:hypothetical protein
MRAHTHTRLNWAVLLRRQMVQCVCHAATVKLAVGLGSGLCWTHFVKGKAVPLQAWGGPEGSRKLKFPDFLTTARDGGKVVSLTHRPHLPPGNIPGTHFC